VVDPDAYGSKGQKWHPAFVGYMVAIATHPAYNGMPDAVKDDGKIQWEAPSNRKSGRYQDTHHKRRDWWREKARSIGVDPESPTWISDTAKRIHPTGEKPCKRCGRVMRIAYAYPNGHLQGRLARTFGDKLEYDPLEPLTDLLQRIGDTFGEEALLTLPALLSTGDIPAPDLGRDLDAWLAWIEEEYIPREPALLSPGAMSNAPDRFDGFHSFNLCCRGTADTGRHDTNMRSYSTDRRVFEYWSEGDWIAADRLMGLINAKFRDHACADGGEGPCTADHIGPLSLGFTHRPEFRLLSKAANSAKNNRMTLRDVQHLVRAEVRGESVVSWHAEPLWNRRKGDVHDEEAALRLSKLLRDNQRVAMAMLGRFLEGGHLAFLATLLELEHADSNVEFKGLAIDEEFVTVFEACVKSPRLTKYAQEQKARRLRIAFEALRSYNAKENRHRFIIEDARIEELVATAFRALERVPPDVKKINKTLQRLLVGTERASEEALREIAQRIPPGNLAHFQEASMALHRAMAAVAGCLSDMWETDRYVRAPFDFDAE
jgi:Alw26I/Eco31I/Esp3I family type II restriction endonuclease